MAKPKRTVLAAAAEASSTPPDALTDSQSIARVVKAEGSSLYTCALPNAKTVLVELDPKFRNTIWIKRGGYVLIDLLATVGMEERRKDSSKSKSKIVGDIVNVVRDEKAWRKQPYWPKQFPKTPALDDDEEESTVGTMPPSDSEEDEEGS